MCYDKGIARVVPGVEQGKNQRERAKSTSTNQVKV
jgi:hypothetical protein